MRQMVEFEDDPPRPAAGDGDVVVKVGSSDVTLRWVNNEISEIIASDEGGTDFSDMTMESQKLRIVTCKKCATDSDTGHTICWPVPC